MAAPTSLTLERGLRVLRVLAEHPEGMTVSELADALGTHRAGIYRLLGPHLAERFVRRRDDRYFLGTGLVELASRVRPRLQEAAGPLLQALADELHATAALTVRDGEDAAVVLDVRSPRHADMHIAYRPGLRHPGGDRRLGDRHPRRRAPTAHRARRGGSGPRARLGAVHGRVAARGERRGGAGWRRRRGRERGVDRRT